MPINVILAALLWIGPLDYYALSGESWQGYGPTTIYIQTASGSIPFPANQENAIDITKHGIPIDAATVTLAGTLICTNSGSEQQNLYVWFRRPGGVWTQPPPQCTAGPGEGRRNWITVEVGAENGEIEFWWQPTGPGYFGINLNIIGYTLHRDP